MQDVPLIKAAYEWLDAAYQAGIVEAVAGRDETASDRLGKKRDILERGIFVLLFGQFEREVDDRFIQARDGRMANPDWRVRRGWDVPALQGRRIPFETRLALMLDRQNPSYAKVIQAYGIRNHCSHGGTSLPVGSIDSLVNDLYVWQALLR